jgi:adenosylcobinamide amidohydrolase
MKLAQFYDGVEVHREEKIIYVKFLAPHRVLSTCRSGAGGLRDDLEYLYNHQVCEPIGHRMDTHKAAVRAPDEYRRLISERHGLPAVKCATLGTAANMNNGAIAHASFRELEVVTICTGGVETNAGRAGDPASYYQVDGRFEMLGREAAEVSRASEVSPGTINTMILINQELEPGVMVSAVITATEAKTAALQELGVPSRYSDGLATGTGTDQIAVAARLGTGTPLSDAGKHSKLGELIGRTVHDAVKQTLLLQNGLIPLRQCSALAHIERLGADRDAMCAGIGVFLSGEEKRLFEQNFSSINGDPPTVAAVAALVHLRDKFVWGILPKSCLPEVMNSYGAQVSAAVSGKHGRLQVYRERLSHEGTSTDNGTFLRFIYRAFALGFSEKWTWS